MCRFLFGLVLLAKGEPAKDLSSPPAINRSPAASIGNPTLGKRMTASTLPSSNHSRGVDQSRQRGPQARYGPNHHVRLGWRQRSDFGVMRER
jgi:hypothetical protein